MLFFNNKNTKNNKNNNMSNLMEAEIKAAIEKNLPSQVGEILSKRLEKAKEDDKLIEQLKSKIEQLTTANHEKESLLNKHDSITNRESSVNAREIAVEKLEINAKISELTYQLEAEKDKTEFSKNVALGLVRNTSYRKNIFDTDNPGGPGIIDGNGNWHAPIGSIKNHTSTETVD